MRCPAVVAFRCEASSSGRACDIPSLVGRRDRDRRRCGSQRSAPQAAWLQWPQWGHAEIKSNRLFLFVLCLRIFNQQVARLLGTLLCHDKLRVIIRIHVGMATLMMAVVLRDVCDRSSVLQ